MSLLYRFWELREFPLIPLLRIEATASIEIVKKQANTIKFPLIPLLRIEATLEEHDDKYGSWHAKFPLIPLLRIEATPLF